MLIFIECQTFPEHKLLCNSNHDETHNVNTREKSGQINLLSELALILQTCTKKNNYTYFSETT